METCSKAFWTVAGGQYCLLILARLSLSPDESSGLKDRLRDAEGPNQVWEGAFDEPIQRLLLASRP